MYTHAGMYINTSQPCVNLVTKQNNLVIISKRLSDLVIVTYEVATTLLNINKVVGSLIYLYGYLPCYGILFFSICASFFLGLQWDQLLLIT